MTFPLYLHIAIAAGGLWASLRFRAPLMLRIYFGFVLVAATSGLWLVRGYGSDFYHLAYYSLEISHSIILAGAAVQLLLIILLPDKLAVGWSVFWLTLALVGSARHALANTTQSLLDLAVAAQFCVLGLLLILALAKVSWTRQTACHAAGLALIALGSLVPHMKLLQSQELWVVASQVADLAGMVVLVLGCWAADETEVCISARD